MSINVHQIEPEIFVCNKETIESVKQHVKLITLFLKETSIFTESYILDYFVQKLWTHLPASWLETVMKFDSHDLELFLNSEGLIRYRNPWPLSLLAFRASAFSLALSRKPVKSLKCVENFLAENFKVDFSSEINWDSLESSYEDKSGQHKSIPAFCRRHVKPKKQHEIFRMAQLTSAVLDTFGVKHIIDIGSGKGHLSRLLALCHKLNVMTVEGEKSHVSSASNFDKEAFKAMKKTKECIDTSKMTNEYNTIDETLPHHLEGTITAESSKEFLKNIFKKLDTQDTSNNFEEEFALLGLHTCGDLSTTILKTFAECQQCKVLFSVGCCYMKLSSDMQDKGYPLSSYVKSLSHHHLSYQAKEMSCHALEMYIHRLRENAPSLKIHCYRATLEKCIVYHYPDRRHMGLRGVKHAEFIEFSEYATKALDKVCCPIPQEFYFLPEIQSCLDRWKEVLIFYSLRLMTAPVVESLILLDRVQYLFEQGYSSCLIPLFDPTLSPRNHVLMSVCTNMTEM